MQRILLFISLSGILLHAQSLSTLIEHALKVHPTLKSIEHRLSQMDDKIALSQNYANPELSMTINDIQFSDISSRDLEPMQYEAINVKQKLPWFGKLQAKKNYTESQKRVILNSYDAARVTLAKEVKTTAFKIGELENRLSILQRYKTVAQQNINIYTSYATTEHKSHTSSMSASLLLSKIKIRMQKYLSLLKSQKAKLKYLLQKEMTVAQNTFQIKHPKPLSYYLAKLEENPTYQMKSSQEDVAHSNKALVDFDATPDPYIKVGYFNRQEYPDFASITAGISLPIYGSESHKSEIARKEILATMNEAIEYKAQLTATIEEEHAKLMEAYMIHKIIKEESLPQLQHMFELTDSSIQKGEDLFTYTNLLENKLSLEEEHIIIQSSYLQTQAKLSSLIGEI